MGSATSPQGQSLLVLDDLNYNQERGTPVRFLRKWETV
ncbi:hypothetical protein CLV84_3490 [Neolewinella xylanilytica]|uniref:Uncharacterized protein n=1 Tax=Neolewinella xylanilytica TaxID=1514080 RepID=A0A2S6I5W9_9BACT|nr:hypothetical protein CLV84_3490 [Neolewinella xylanilytica]